MRIKIAAMLSMVLGVGCASESPNNTALMMLLLLSSGGSSSSSCSVSASDALFSNQWHLQNTGQSGATAGEDSRVCVPWSESRFGAGVSVAVVDDGLEIAHEDLTENIEAGKSWDYPGADTDPTNTSNNHGTAVGGVMAGRMNSIGIRGSAPLASLRGYNLLAQYNATNRADAMTRDVANVHVSNNSWGPSDNFGTYTDSEGTWRTAIETGLSSGRGNKGTVYVWAAGNGAQCSDNSNYDGFANYHGVVNVGAIGANGTKANYSESGANLWVVAHSQGTTGPAITTTDNSGANGYNTNGSSNNYSNLNYTNTFNGTSSAAPLAAGVIALVLEANSALTWRDVKLILAESSRKNDSSDSGWLTAGSKVSGSGSYNFNHKYGFGAIDAGAAVALAKTWTNVGAQATHTTSTSSPGTAIPDNNATGVSNSIVVSGSGINQIEFIEINLTSNHTYVGDLAVTLQSPAGTISTLAETHICRTSSCGGSAAGCTFPGGTWRYGSARHLGEAANGTWTITVRDGGAADTGNLTSWSMKFYGR